MGPGVRRDDVNCYLRAPRQLVGNEFCLHSANHKPVRFVGPGGERVRIMLRFKILASAVPLLIVAVFARGGLLPGPRPCISIGEASVQIASAPWHADLHVSFTDDPAQATVRVQLSDSADAADFAVVDDIDTPEAGACEANPATRMVAISATPSTDAPVIYLSNEGPADYRIFVRSKTFTARDAAALIVGAGGGHHRLAAASL